jgi:predicted NBD/HSP70 family sugar kinase
MEKVITLGEILKAALIEDRKHFEAFASTCGERFGKICVNTDNSGILCMYDGCPYRVIKK